jgi:4-hydroxy-tetrahydrodipicolinate synthase
MSAFDYRRLHGMHAATIVPMTPEYQVDERALARHIAEVAHTPGIHGLLVNGHAGENFVLDAAEKRRVVEIARAEAPANCVICSGVNAESSLEAARDARIAEEAGADLLLLFPPNSFALGHDRRAALIHHRQVLAASGLPMLLYGAPVGAGAMAYDRETLLELAAEPRVLGIKEGSWEVAAYEAHRRLLKALRPDFVVMGSGDEHLLTSYVIGSDGSQVSLAAIAPMLCADFYSAASAGNWTEARRLHDRIYPLSRAIYRDPPGGRATARIKRGLEMLGRIDCSVVRPPQPPASVAEEHAMDEALRAAGLIPGP